MSKGKALKLSIFVFVMMALAIGIYFVSLMNLSGKRANNPVTKCKSVSEIRNKTGWDFDVPEFLSSEKNVKYSLINNELVEISNDYFRYCVAKFVDYSVNSTGSYGEYEVDKWYKYGDTGIVLRCRANEYETVVDWYDDEFMYGLIISGYDYKNGSRQLIEALGFYYDKLIETTLEKIKAKT